MGRGSRVGVGLRSTHCVLDPRHQAAVDSLGVRSARRSCVDRLFPGRGVTIEGLCASTLVTGHLDVGEGCLMNNNN